VSCFSSRSGVIECKEPIEVVSYKIGVCKVSPKGKDCLTKFEKLGYNGTTSVVLCKPLTGRMHQIRVHLQYLGEISALMRFVDDESRLHCEDE
jgi:23S rRNA-/tRNA-specific pseudouridylate synthase